MFETGTKAVGSNEGENQDENVKAVFSSRGIFFFSVAWRVPLAEYRAPCAGVPCRVARQRRNRHDDSKKAGTSLCPNANHPLFSSAQLITMSPPLDRGVILEQQFGGLTDGGVCPARCQRLWQKATVRYRGLGCALLLDVIDMIGVAKKGDGRPYAHCADGARYLHAAQCARHTLNDDPVVLG